MSRFKLLSNSAFGPYVSYSSRIEGKQIRLLFRAYRAWIKRNIQVTRGVTAKSCDGSSGGGADGVAEGSVDEPTAPSLSGKPHVSDCGRTRLFKASDCSPGAEQSHRNLVVFSSRVPHLDLNLVPCFRIINCLIVNKGNKL